MSAVPADLPSLATPVRADAALPPPLAAGSAAHRSAKWALFVGGFATFAMFYGPQPLLPLFGTEFDLSAAQASGVLSATAGAMALGLIPAGFLAQRYGPKPVMLSAIVLGALCSLLCAVAPNYPSLIALRALLGVCLAGLPAVASAWLAEEMDAKALGQAVGLIIAGNAAGGMSSRLVCGLLADWVGWRVAFAGPGRARRDRRVRVLAQPAGVAPPSPAAAASAPRAGRPARRVRRARPSAAVRAGAAADGQLRQLLQLPRLPPRAGAVRAVARDDRRDLPALRGGHVLVALGGTAGRPASGSSRVLAGMLALCGGGARADAVVTRCPLIIAGRGAVHLRLLRGALGREQLGRRASRSAFEGARLGRVPHGVLRRCASFDGLARRPRLAGRRVAGRDRVSRRAVARLRGHRVVDGKDAAE